MSDRGALVLLTRPGCHLCERVRSPLADLAERHGWQLEEADVDADPGHRARYGRRIPVLLWAGEVVAEGRFSPESALAKVIAAAAGRTIR